MWRRLLDRGLSLALLVLLLAWALGQLPFSFWAFELFSHFVFQYLVLAGVLLMVAVMLRAWLRAGTAAVMLLYLGFAFHGAYGASSQAWDNACSGETLRVVSYNMQSSQNPNLSEAWARIVALDPDFVVLLELWGREVPAWLATNNHTFPYSFRPDAYAAPVILSRWPLQQMASDEGAFRYLRNEFDRVFGARAIAQTPKGQIQLYAVHLPVPLSGVNRLGQDLLIEDVGRTIADAPIPVLVAGDFNATPWSTFLQDFLQENELTNAFSGHLPWPTWFRAFPPLALPIDHIFVSREWKVVRAVALDEWGSDHRAIMSELCLLPSSM